MGFNIGRFFKKIAGPLIGGFIGGPVGAVVGGGISQAFGSDAPEAAATAGRQTQPGPVSQPALIAGAPSGRFIQASSVVPVAASLAKLPSALGALGTGLGALSLFGGGSNGSSNPISIILAKARAATGGPVTRNKIIDAAKVCGLEIAAQTFGLDVREVCMVVVKGRSRRRRGVSAADIRRTKRTINFASKIRKDLKVLAR